MEESTSRELSSSEVQARLRQLYEERKPEWSLEDRSAEGPTIRVDGAFVRPGYSEKVNIICRQPVTAAEVQRAFDEACFLAEALLIR